ncbi:protein NRT1/ PTR FAMILY 5.10-like [Tripterygium wilfordii]|uniref:protein NRT1/ PTR FAMILY 5.10-like n=1 Tax=Tripterygium wilfordii TaxID=458696 RepID=UPI0018F857A1|nr:protein NRT1/ PTR FAMILY 5.10-like [Tripterygium wilfordii]
MLGLGLLTLLAVLTSDYQNTSNTTSSSPPQIYVTLFYLALYLVAIGEGGHKPCLMAFGADQFDGKDPEESKSKSSYFNWLYFSFSMAVICTLLVMVYVQDNFGWALGFGIPCLMMGASLFLFLLGTKTYRYTTAQANYKDHPFVKIGRVFAASVRRRRPPIAAEERACDSNTNKPLLTPTNPVEGRKVRSTTGEVEEAKAVLRLIPIWASCLVYATVMAQIPTFFTKQGVTLDRKIASNFVIPAASLQSFVGTAIVLSMPVYDRVFVPIARSITRKQSGITTLQRVGIGMVLSATSTVIAALIEMKRLKTAEEYGLVDNPQATVPMSIWWLVPQYILFGAADVFTIVGLQEFFYDQVPKELRSMGVSLNLSIFGVGSLLSSLLVSAIDKGSNKSWFNDNLNQAHLDYFYWLLAGLSVLGLVSFFNSAKSYVYCKEIA